MRYPDKIDAIISLRPESAPLKLVHAITNEPIFRECSGSAKEEHHHYGNGGLQYHTWEVVSLCLDNARRFSALDIDTLYLAALYHDIGKTYDYGIKDGAWIGTVHKRQIHHISRSALIWSDISKECGYHDKNDAVLHCILSHHGQREWGSPVAPATKEAWMLHLCDAMSARMDDCEKMDILDK